MTRSSKQYVLTVGIKGGTDNSRWPGIVSELERYGIREDEVDILDIPVTDVVMISAEKAWEGLRGDYLSLVKSRHSSEDKDER